MEKKEYEEKPSKIFNVLITLSLFVYLMIDSYIMSEGEVIPLWYHAYNLSFYLICDILAYFEGRNIAYKTNIYIDEQIKKEEELKAFHDESIYGKRNDKKIALYLILSIIFIAAVVLLTLYGKGLAIKIIETICELVAIIITISFAIALGKRSGALKALRRKMDK